MNVSPPMLQFITGTTHWLEKTTNNRKSAAFQRLKRKMLREDLRKLGKGAFVSVNSTTDNNTSSSFIITNNISICDFRPLEPNYTSIKILDFETHGVMEDLNVSRARKIEYTSSQLLNKETFLDQWMVRLPAPSLLPQHYPFSDYALRSITTYHQQALATIRKFTFSKYCKQRLRTKTPFLGISCSSDPLKYKKTMISHSLTHLQGPSNQIALQAFQTLLRAGGECEPQKNNLYEISKLIEMAVAADDAVKEEIFLQVIKQTSSRKLIHMRILCCLCYCVKIPTRFYIPFLNYLYEEATIFEIFPKELLNYCFYHAIKNFDGKRLSSPCIFELYCAYHAAKVPVIIKFPREKAFFIESYTTVEELIRQLIEFYSLDQNIEYLLQVNKFLMERGNLLENLNHYSELQVEDYKWTDYQNFTGLSAVIALKNVDDGTHSPRCHNIMYNYCTNHYLRKLYSLTSSEVIRIAALKMHAQLFDEENYIFQYDNLITDRKLRRLTKEKKIQYRKHIIRHYYRICHLTKTEARQKILDILANKKGHNTHFFKCMIKVEDFEACPAWVGVERSAFLIIEPTTGRTMNTVAFNRISEWGRTTSELCLKVDVIGDFHIFSLQIDVLISVFQTYINYHLHLLNSY